MNDSIQNLERLVEAVEQAGANLAPTYQEYMPLAFAVANSCGQSGRPLFHRLCCLSPKYNAHEADTLYDHALQKGTGANTLGTVYHLAELAGVDKKKLANLQNLQNLQASLTHTHTHACASPLPMQSPTPLPTTPKGSAAPTAFAPATLADTAAKLPCFIPHPLPPFLQQIIDCGNSPAQRDILLLGAVTVLGSTLNRLLSFTYGQKSKYPCLQTFIVAPPASGKGALTWIRRLAEPIHEALLDTYQEKMKAYRCEKIKWDVAGKEKINIDEPQPPCLKMHLIAGDNTGTGILENLIDSEGVGLICETEADTVSSAIGSDYGHWSDTLRKSFDHERLAYNRRTNHEYRECRQSFLSVLLSGTPAQVKPLIPSAENGLFSRQLFYYMHGIDEWEDQFCRSDLDYDLLFRSWGMRWKEVVDALKGSVGGIHLQLTDEQKSTFNTHLARVFERAGAVHGDSMKSAVVRIAINLCRIMSVVGLLRSLEALLPGGKQAHASFGPPVQTLLSCPGIVPSPHTPRENLADGVVSQFDLTISASDFEAVLALAEPLYRHACHILSFLPVVEPVVASVAAAPATLFDRLPLHFSRSEAMAEAEREGMLATTLDSLLRRMTERGQLIKTGRGEYEFSSRVRTRVRVCVEGPASSASLQVSENESVG